MEGEAWRGVSGSGGHEVGNAEVPLSINTNHDQKKKCTTQSNSFQDLEQLKQRAKEMEEEADRLKELQYKMEKEPHRKELNDRISHEDGKRFTQKKQKEKRDLHADTTPLKDMNSPT